MQAALDDPMTEEELKRIRVSPETVRLANIAAGIEGMRVARWMDKVLMEVANRVIDEFEETRKASRKPKGK
jgi:uncharacterized protein (DUF1778 family)